MRSIITILAAFLELVAAAPVVNGRMAGASDVSEPCNLLRHDERVDVSVPENLLKRDEATDVTVPDNLLRRDVDSDVDVPDNLL